MGKNLMTEVAALLGVEIGEKFIIENAEHNLQVVLVADGLHVTKDDFLGSSNSKLLQNVLCGLFRVKKLPWEPREGDMYYILNTGALIVESYSWGNSTFDLAVKSLGIIHRTEEEAEAHFAEDYEKLTGKELGDVQANS